MNNWWKEAVIYQIYPRSFKDSNGDGVGDLKGITSKLDYLKLLGIDIIWISPIFSSPNADNGYDVSDYQNIMSDFGSMEDFDELLNEAHQKGLKVILDLVVNHSSDEHFWFQEAKKSIENPYREYYIWKKPDKNGNPPNDWISFFSGNAWELDETTGEYYLHLFLKKQPDLNWENPKLRQEIYDMMHFWFKKGIDGFRMDVIPFISKHTNFPNFPKNRVGDLSFYANGPRLHEFLREMNEKVLSQYDCVSIGEGFGVSAEQANLYVGKDRKELSMIYHFDHAVPRYEHSFIHPSPEFTLPQIKAIFNKWDAELGENGWQNAYFGNHDNPRIVSRLGETANFHEKSAKLIAMALLTQRATPGIYQGDELGMTNCNFEHISEFNDVQVLNAYQALVVEKNEDEQQFLKASNYIARDHARTPMQWDESQYAGFSSNEPWLKVNSNYASINAKKQMEDENSIFHFYRTMITLRKENKALIYGKYQDLNPKNKKIWAFTRIFEEKILLIVLNFSTTKTRFKLPFSIENSIILVSNDIKTNKKAKQILTLDAYEGRVYAL